MKKRREHEIPSTTFAFTWFAIKPHKKWFYGAVFFSAFSEIASALQSYAFKGFTDAAGVAAAGGGSQGVFFWVLASPILLFFTAAAIRGGGYMMTYLAANVRTGASRALFEYLSFHSMSYFNDRFSGALSGRVITVSQSSFRIIDQFVWQFLGLVVSFASTAVLLYFQNAPLAALFSIGFLALIPVNIYLTRSQVAFAKDRALSLARLKGNVIDAITNISSIQQYARRSHELDRLDGSINESRKSDIVSGVFREKVLLLNNLIVSIFIAAIIMRAYVLWAAGSITIGALVMVVVLTRGFMRTLSHIGNILNQIMDAYGEVREGLDEIIAPYGIDDALHAMPLKISHGAVLFENVDFAYSDTTPQVFRGLSFNVKAGEKIGIVGTSGAGKTTLMKLLLRQHDVQAGSIRIDGFNIKEVTLDSLRETVAIVPQEPMLFHRTIRENISYGKLDATDAEIVEVARKAQAHDFIDALPLKYDSLVGERGVKLSVGQRQRIAIARAFLKNAPILVLDEATSALDSESEVAVQKALASLMEGKTVFAIAHRLSTLREMDRIIVFKEGQIVEEGTHRSLLVKKGAYASLWAHQAGGFLKDNSN